MNDADLCGENPTIVIIAEHNDRHRTQIQEILVDFGVVNLIKVNDKAEIFQAIRQYHSNLDHIGLLIISEGFPGCNLPHVCNTVAGAEGGINIPVIVLTDSKSTPANSSLASLTGAITVLCKPVRSWEFLPIVNLSLQLRKERALRRVLEEKLLSQISEIKILVARLKYLVKNDELTGLANRRSLENAIRVALYRNRLLNQAGALIYIDLDLFSLINHIEGHEMGDRLLVEAGNLLYSNPKPEYLISRVGSDEFCILLQNIDRQEVLRIAEGLRQKFDNYVFNTNRDSYSITASFGVALLDKVSRFNHSSELICRAQRACSAAKHTGGNRVFLYNEEDPLMGDPAKDTRMAPRIRDALVENGFFLVFQPVVRLSDEMITHFEAFVRMRSRMGEVIKPSEFIPVAERMGLIRSIDLWVLDAAIEFLGSLSERYAHVGLNINISAATFQDTDFLPILQQKLESAWIAPNRITFEISETTAIANTENTRDAIQRLRGLGCRFAVDDFGCGFSSVELLKKIPVDFWKIDGPFIQNLPYDDIDVTLVKTIIDIARKLGKKTIAEYVEHPRIFHILKNLGVDYVQGYILGEPSENLPNSLKLDKAKIETTSAISDARTKQGIEPIESLGANDSSLSPSK